MFQLRHRILTLLTPSASAQLLAFSTPTMRRSVMAECGLNAELPRATPALQTACVSVRQKRRNLAATAYIFQRP